MKQRTFTKEQRKFLESNPNVIRVTKHRINYSPSFKKKAIHQYHQEGKDPRSIFYEAGFPEYIVDSEIPLSLLKNWRTKAQVLGTQTDFTDKRGTASKKKSTDLVSMTDREKIKYYEAMVAFKEAENAFLAEARGLKRWPEFVWEPGKNSDS